MGGSIYLCGGAAAFPNYAAAVAMAGGRLAARPEDAGGLLLPGGGDMAPALCGLPDGAPCRDVDEARDRRELALCRAFLEAGRPVLGICRGAQVLAVALGGTLLADVPGHGGLPGGGDRIHETRTAGLLTGLYGPDCAVNSCHHQAVDRLPPDCAVLQVALDGVVEAFGHRRQIAVGVQWHPERLCGPFARADAVSGLPLLAWFTAACGGGA